jgi:hypothetical protein
MSASHHAVFGRLRWIGCPAAIDDTIPSFGVAMQAAPVYQSRNISFVFSN